MFEFPKAGVPAAQLEEAIDKLVAQDLAWREGRIPLYTFRGDEDAFQVGRNAFFKLFSENALGANRAFTSVKQMQEEVIGMCLSLLNGDSETQGTFTSGGTESIFLSVRAARAEARASGKAARGTGNIVMPATAHPAFSKAAECMDLEERRIPVRSSGRADVAAMSQAIDSETVMLVGSAPCFPYGVIDPIEELGELALSHGVWLHVDACVGGYLAPFVRDIGYPVPPFDLSVKGVASLSADLHKYGYCPKPASTVFFSNAVRHEMAGFDIDAWPSGRFVTPTLVGTRPAGGVAGAWATLKFLGGDGYRVLARRLMDLRDSYLSGIRKIPGYQTTAEPDLAIIAFRNPNLDIPQVAALMREKGWLPGMTAQPQGLHLMLSMLHESSRDSYINDLASCSATVSARTADGGYGARESAEY